MYGMDKDKKPSHATVPLNGNWEKTTRNIYRNLDGGIDLVDGENTAQLLGKFLNLWTLLRVLAELGQEN
jgi:hypothetical protein